MDSVITFCCAKFTEKKPTAAAAILFCFGQRTTPVTIVDRRRRQTYVHKGLLNVFQGGHRGLGIVLVPEPGVNSLQGAVGATPPCIVSLVLHGQHCAQTQHQTGLCTPLGCFWSTDSCHDTSRHRLSILAFSFSFCIVWVYQTPYHHWHIIRCMVPTQATSRSSEVIAAGNMINLQGNAQVYECHRRHPDIRTESKHNWECPDAHHFSVITQARNKHRPCKLQPHCITMPGEVHATQQQTDLHVMVVVIAAFNHMDIASRDWWGWYAHMHIRQPHGLATCHTLRRPCD